MTPIVLEGRITRSQREHDEILKRLFERDGPGAAAALERHIDNAGIELRRRMDDGAMSTPPKSVTGKEKRRWTSR